MTTTDWLLLAGLGYLVLGPPKILGNLLGGATAQQPTQPQPVPASSPDLGTQIVGGAVTLGTALIKGIFGGSGGSVAA